MNFDQFQAKALPIIIPDNTSPSFWGNGLGGEGAETVEALMNCLGLTLATGRLQNIAKKIERDHPNSTATPEYLEAALLQEGGDVLFYLRQVLDGQGLTLEHAAQVCLDKLDAMKAART